MSLLDHIAGAQEKVLRPSGGCHSCPRKRRSLVSAALRPGQVIFVGEMPGEDDVAVGEGFAGASGQLLRQLAKDAGVPEPWSFTHIVHCRAGGDAIKPKEVSCCLSQFVLDEVKDYAFIVLVGNAAVQAFFPGSNANHLRGNVTWHPDFPAQRFYAIDHPAFVLKRPELKDLYYKRLQRLARVMRGDDGPQVNVIHGAAAVPTLREWMKAPLWSLDLETTRLEAFAADGRIKSLAVTVNGQDVVFGQEEEPHFQALLQLAAEYITKPDKSVVGHHIGFDLVWLEQVCGVRAQVQLVHETGVQWYQAKQYKMPSLKELVSKELDGYRYLIQQPHLEKDVGRLMKYNAEDVVYPLQLMKTAMKVLRPKTRDLVTRVLGPAEVILTRMGTTGIYLRQDYRQQKTDEYNERRRELVQAWKDEDPEFIPSEHESGDGLLRYLFDIRRLPVLERTDTGVPVTDKSTIKQWLRDGHTIVRHLLELREIDKIIGTYLTAYDKHVWPDSRVRSSYPLTWTDSGRSSSRSPNLQNIPRKKEIRDLFGAPPGAVLLESDLSQIEFRIMVCLANDSNGIAGYARGEDAHTMTARKIAGVDKPTKEQRSNAKPVNFMFLYGGSAPTAQKIAADDYGVLWSDRQAAQFREMFMATYPGIPVFHEESKRRLIQNRGWFESVVGHVFHYNEWDAKDSGKRDHAFRAALNAEAQGPAAQLAFYIMVLARRLLDARGFQSVEFVNTVHDSIMTEIPNPAWVGDVIATIDEASQLAHAWVKDWFVVPLVMEHEVGESWGSLRPYSG